MDAFELVGKLTLESDVPSKLDTAESKGINTWGVMVGNLAAKAFASTFSAATKFARSVFETGMDFDAMMSSVDAVKDMTEEEFTAIREQAIELGRTTKYTATEVGEGLYYMGLAGWSSEEMLAGIPAVLQLAAASGENLGRSSDIVTDAITALGYEAEDAGHFVDVLAAAASNSNTTVGMMGEAFKYLATVGGTLNYSVEDVALTLGLLANNGIKASQAGTSMRQILNTLIAPSGEAAMAMMDLGLSLFEPDTGARKPLVQVLGEMREIFKTADFDLAGRSIEDIATKEAELTELLETGTISERTYNEEMAKYLNSNVDFLRKLSDIGGLRGISSLLALMKSSDEDFNQLVDSIYNSEGAAERMQEKQMSNLKGDITLLNSAIDGLKIAMFDEINPAAREFVQTLTEGVTKITKLLKGEVEAEVAPSEALAGEVFIDKELRHYQLDEEQAASLYGTRWLMQNNPDALVKGTDGVTRDITEAFIKQFRDTLEASGFDSGWIDKLSENVENLDDVEFGQLMDRLSDANALYEVSNTAVQQLGTDSANTSASVETLGMSASSAATVLSNLHVPEGFHQAKGDWDVPYDNYPSLLHRGEMVLTASQARRYRNGEGGASIDPGMFGEAVRSAIIGMPMMLNDEVVGRVMGNAVTGTVNNNIGSINARRRFGYGG